MPLKASKVESWMPRSHKYGKDHELQRLTVWSKAVDGSETTPTPRETSRIWIIYLHGGAWRDPNTTDTSFNPTIQQLVSNPTYNSLIEDHVDAFASIDYRLTPHPNYPQDEATTPASQYRGAKHPDHITDVLSAISWLQKHYKFGDDYMLIGHSCGATLALQTVMGDNLGRSAEGEAKIVLPKAVAGVAGIYDLRLLRDTHTHPEYNRFLTDAFGKDLEVWDTVSPARYEGYGTWKEGRLLVLASSKDDELIDDPQIDTMGNLNLGDGTRLVSMKHELEGTHDHTWGKGVQLAKVVAKTLEELAASLHDSRNP